MYNRSQVNAEMIRVLETSMLVFKSWIDGRLMKTSVVLQCDEEPKDGLNGCPRSDPGGGTS